MKWSLVFQCHLCLTPITMYEPCIIRFHHKSTLNCVLFLCGMRDENAIVKGATKTCQVVSSQHTVTMWFDILHWPTLFEAG